MRMYVHCTLREWQKLKVYGGFSISFSAHGFRPQFKTRKVHYSSSIIFLMRASEHIVKIMTILETR